MPKLLIVYILGYWGPERILGYIVVKEPFPKCLLDSTHKTWDVIGEAQSDLRKQIAEYHKTNPRAIRITNPLGIKNTRDFRKWQRTQCR